MNNSPETVARAYIEAISNKDLARVEALIDPAIHFIGPARTLSGAGELLEALRRLGAIHVRNEIKRVFHDGDEVCVIYDFVTDVVGAVPTVEWVRIAGGRIRAVNLYYDQVPWLAVREELARRATKASA